MNPAVDEGRLVESDASRPTPSLRSGVLPADRLANPRKALICLALFFSFFSFSLLTSGGHGYSIDGELYYQVAESAVLRGSIVPIVSDSLQPSLRRGPSGQSYSKYAPGQSLVEAPLVGVAVLSGRIAGVDDTLVRPFSRVWVPIIANCAISAAVVGVLFVLLAALGHRESTALLLCAIAGFGSPLWPYARTDFSEPLQALLLLAAFLSLRSRKTRSSSTQAIATGLLLGGLVLTKASYVVLLPIFAGGLLWLSWRSGLAAVLERLALYGLGAVAPTAVYLLYNYARYGNALDFGYNESFDTPLLVGLHGLLLSPGKSVFLYCPPLIAALAASGQFARRLRFEATLIALSFGVLLVAYSGFWAWHGDWAWGPRFIVPVIPLLLLPLGWAWESRRGFWRALVLATALAGVSVQLLGVSVDPTKYLSLQSQPGDALNHPPSADVIHFVPQYSPLVGHYWLLKESIHQLSSPDRLKRSDVAYPWNLGHTGQPWSPPHSADFLGLDYWFLAPSAIRSPAAYLVLSLSSVGFGASLAALSWSRRWRGQPGAAG